MTRDLISFRPATRARDDVRSQSLCSMMRMRLLSAALAPLIIATVQATESSNKSQKCPAFTIPKTTEQRRHASAPAARLSSQHICQSNKSPSVATTNMSSTKETDTDDLEQQSSTDPSTSSESPAGGETTKETNTDDLVQQSIERLRERGIKVVIFDMDLTIVKQHSRGRMQRGEPLEVFLSLVSPDFVKLAPALHKQGFHLAIATHSDEAEYSRRITPTMHILGDELAKTVLQRHLPPEVADSFFVVAYNPYARRNPFQTFFGDWAKRHHMNLIQNHYQVQPQEIVLFDDTLPIVMDCRRKCGIQAVQVSPLVGFTMKDILDKL